jgi:hypothetical protein
MLRKISPKLCRKSNTGRVRGRTKLQISTLSGVSDIYYKKLNIMLYHALLTSQIRFTLYKKLRIHQSIRSEGQGIFSLAPHYLLSYLAE